MYDPATTTVTYSSQTRSISLEIPYNPNWGSDKYRINPYEEREAMGMLPERLEFGSIVVFEGCSWVRDHVFSFLPAKSADEVISDMISDIKKDPIFSEFFPILPNKTTINGLEVVKYEEGGLCTYPTLQVIGEKYNYELRPLCGKSGEFQYLENIVKTIKFID